MTLRERNSHWLVPLGFSELVQPCSLNGRVFFERTFVRSKAALRLAFMLSTCMQRVGLGLLIVSGLSPTASMAQVNAVSQPLQICAMLAQSKLIDKSDTELVVDTSQREFDNVCSSKQNRRERLNSSSAQFQASFSGFGGGGGGSSSATDIDAVIERSCKNSAAQFSNYMRQRSTSVTSSFLVGQINECLKIAAATDKEFIGGWTESTSDDDRFFARIVFSFGEVPVYDYKFDRIEGDAIECNLGGAPGAKSAIGSTLRPPRFTMTCHKSQKNDAKGAFIFKSEKLNRQLDINYAVISKSTEKREKELRERIEADYKSQLSKTVEEVKKGAVTWIERAAHHKSCAEVCKARDHSPVVTGNDPIGEPYMVCAASISGGGPGDRPGFHTPNADLCHVFSGGKTAGGEKSSSYKCLCRDLP